MTPKGRRGGGRGKTNQLAHEQKPIRRRWERAPELSHVWWEWVNPLVTLGSRTGERGTKGDVMHTQRPETYLSAKGTKTCISMLEVVREKQDLRSTVEFFTLFHH